LPGKILRVVEFRDLRGRFEPPADFEQVAVLETGGRRRPHQHAADAIAPAPVDQHFADTEPVNAGCEAILRRLGDDGPKS